MATKFFMNGGVNSNWSTDGNWSTTASSGPANTTKAVNGDVATFDSGSPSCTIDTASACTTLTCTGYTHTMTFNGTLTVAGAVTFASGMTIAGTSDLICTTTATLTSGGNTLTGGLQFTGASQTFTLSGAWVVNGLVQTNTAKLLGSTLSVAGGLTSAGNMTTGGTTVITLTGGTWSGAFAVRCPITFAGNVTVSGSVAVNDSTSIITYSSGTITTTGSTLTLGTASRLSTSGMTWNNVVLSASNQLDSTLSSTTITLPNGACVMTGVAGFTCTTLTCNALTASRTATLKSGITYTATSSIDFNQGLTSAIRLAIVASTPGSKAILTLNTGSDACLAFVDPTDIDSSGGIPIYTYKGTITTSTNWVAGSLTLPSASNVKTGTGTYGYSDAPITPSYTASGSNRGILTGGRL